MLWHVPHAVCTLFRLLRTDMDSAHRSSIRSTVQKLHVGDFAVEEVIRDRGSFLVATQHLSLRPGNVRQSSVITCDARQFVCYFPGKGRIAPVRII